MKITKKKFISLLRRTAELIEKNDSFEGSLAYEQVDNDNFDINAFIKCGNSLGQGGAIIIQDKC